MGLPHLFPDREVHWPGTNRLPVEERQMALLVTAAHPCRLHEAWKEVLGHPHTVQGLSTKPLALINFMLHSPPAPWLTFPSAASPRLLGLTLASKCHLIGIRVSIYEFGGGAQIFSPVRFLWLQVTETHRESSGRQKPGKREGSQGGLLTLPWERWPPGWCAQAMGGTNHPLRNRTRYSNFYFYLVLSHVNFFYFCMF